MAGHDDAGSPKPGTEIPLEAIPLHSTNLLTLLDESGVIHYESPSIERVFGFAQDELVGEPVAAYFHPEDRDRVLEAFERVVSSEEYTVEAVEYRHRQADGTYRWVESVSSSNPTPAGRYVINTRDVTHRKERRTELAKQNRNLEQFASVVGHDLRNPLNVAKIKRAELADECDSEHLEELERAHDRMERLIDDLLTLARAGKRTDEAELVHLTIVINACWESVATGSATKHVEIDRHVKADRSRLQQLLENLVRNAVENGGADVTIRFGELSDRTGFFVADDGPGIPADQAERVLESGYSTRQDGTGLGLAIVREIAEAHGWEVAVSESADGGARFEFVGVELH